MARIAALFDMDRTLLDTSSGVLYARYLVRHGQWARRQLARVAWWRMLSWLGVLDAHGLAARMLLDAAGEDEQELWLLCERWFEQDVIPHIAKRGRQCMADHKARGHRVAIVSGSAQFATAPLAAYLGIPDQYVCTQLESKDGRLTGEIVPPVCYGPGKVVWAERFAAEHDVDLSASWFYTDSISDLPLLERVAFPVAVNPDPRLRRLARKRQWPIEMFY